MILNHEDRTADRARVHEQQQVLIIGAGPAGLAAAAELRHHGVESLIIDRADSVASSWRNRYDALRLNTCRWNSQLRAGDRFAPGTPFFPLREHAVEYLERFADTHEANIRFGVGVERIDPADGGWCVSTSAGPMTARQVVVATGHQHTPRLPPWAQGGGFAGRVLHSHEYRRAADHRGLDVLVVGSGCSGLDIARDLAHGGASRVRVAVRTPPNLLRKRSLGLPTDLTAAVLHRMPVRWADAVSRSAQKLTIGDLTHRGLAWPEVGVFTDLRHHGSPPVIVADEVIEALRAGDVEVVAAVVGAQDDRIHLADGTVLAPDLVIAATGYTTGLQALVGHLDVLDGTGRPREYRRAPLRPGLHFLGYAPCMGVIGRDARRVMRHVISERAAIA